MVLKAGAREETDEKASSWVVAGALVAYTAVVTAISHTPQSTLPAILGQFPDKALHALEYVPLGFLWSRVFRGTLRRRFWLGWTTACAFALADEIHQAFVPGRIADGADWVADALGALLGAAAGARWGQSRSGRPLPQVPGRNPCAKN